MPYVEVWVDEENLTDDQWNAIRWLVTVAIEAAADLWPSDEARKLESAAVDVIRTVLLDDTAEKQFEADRKYHEWMQKRRNTGAQTESSG